MPGIGPQEAQGLVDMLEALQAAEARGKVPPGSYQQALSEAESQYEYSMPADRGGSGGYSGRIDGGVTRAPWATDSEYYMPGNFERGQRMANSMAEDAALRESMKYTRRRSEEDGPPGHYTLAKYPGVEHDIWRVEHGFGGKGYGTRTAFMNPDEQGAFNRRAKEFARHQRKLLGMEEAPTHEETWGRSRRESDRMRRYREEWGY